MGAIVGKDCTPAYPGARKLATRASGRTERLQMRPRKIENVRAAQALFGRRANRVVAVFRLALRTPPPTHVTFFSEPLFVGLGGI